MTAIGNKAKDPATYMKEPQLAVANQTTQKQTAVTAGAGMLTAAAMGGQVTSSEARATLSTALEKQGYSGRDAAAVANKDFGDAVEKASGGDIAGAATGAALWVKNVPPAGQLNPAAVGQHVDSSTTTISDGVVKGLTDAFNAAFGTGST